MAGSDVRRELGGGGRVAAAAGVEDVEERLRLEACGRAEDQRLGGDRDRGRREQVVEHLRQLPLTGLAADVKHVLAEGPQERLDARQCLVLTRGHDGERPRVRPGHAAADRGVHDRDAFRCEGLCDLAGHRNARSREVDVHLQRPSACEAVVPAGDLPDDGRRREAHEHDLSLIRDVPRRAGDLRAGAERLGFRRLDVVHDEVMARLEQRAGERRADRTEADEPERMLARHTAPFPAPSSATGGCAS